MKIILVLLSVLGISYAVGFPVFDNRFRLKSSIQFGFQALDIPDHLRAPLKVMRKACVAESNVDEKYIDASKNGNLPDVPELRCYILCLFEHAGMIEDDGTIHFKQIMHMLTPSIQETASLVMKECETKRENGLFCKNFFVCFKLALTCFRW